MDNKKALIIFIKNPEPGKVKTRLAKTIGNKSALAIYKRMLRHTMNVSLQLKVNRQVWYSSFVDKSDNWNSSRFKKYLQTGDNLGERMKNAFAQAFRENYKQVVIIGSDCPELSARLLDDAYRALQASDLVIGLAEDGGYYLLGMKTFQPQLFTDIPWSTHS